MERKVDEAESRTNTKTFGLGKLNFFLIKGSLEELTQSRVAERRAVVGGGIWRQWWLTVVDK